LNAKKSFSGFLKQKNPAFIKGLTTLKKLKHNFFRLEVDGHKN